MERLHSQKFTVVANTGAYGTHGLTVQTVTGLRGLSSYNCPNRQFDCTVAYTNLPVPGAYRGYGAPQALFSLENHMDEIAHEMGLIQLNSAARIGSRQAIQCRSHPCWVKERRKQSSTCRSSNPVDLNECFAQGMKAIGWQRKMEPDFHIGSRQTPPAPRARRSDVYARDSHSRSGYGCSQHQD